MVRLAQRVRLSIFLCFFLRIRLRRFLINDPMRGRTLVDASTREKAEPTKRRSTHRVADSGGCSHADPSFGDFTMTNADDRPRVEW